MNEPKDQLDTAIDHKFDEIKDLLLAREVRDRLSLITGEALTLAPLQLQPAEAAAKPKPKKDRKKAIADSAAKAKKSKRGGKKGGTRRKFTTAFKLQVLGEVIEEGSKQPVLDRHNLYPSHLVTWQRQKDAGKLIADEEPEEPEASAEPFVGEITMPQGDSTTLVVDADGEESDLVAEMKEGERPHVPFAGAPTKEEMDTFQP